MTIRIALTTALLSLSLAACGGKSKPADSTPPAEETKVAGDCCCEFIEETGEGDEMAENQVRRLMSAQECEQNTGTCVTDDPTCAATE